MATFASVLILGIISGQTRNETSTNSPRGYQTTVGGTCLVIYESTSEPARITSEKQEIDPQSKTEPNASENTLSFATIQWQGVRTPRVPRLFGYS